MDLVKQSAQFSDHKSCITYLEKLRWCQECECPYCCCADVARKAEGERIGRWNCKGCKSSFNVLTGTIFQGTKIPLQKWFHAISLVLNSEKSLSSYQLAQNLSLNQKTAWYMATRIRKAFSQNDMFLCGIMEAGECCNESIRCEPNKQSDKTVIEEDGPLSEGGCCDESR